MMLILSGICLIWDIELVLTDREITKAWSGCRVVDESAGKSGDGCAI